MKITIFTPTYNRAYILPQLYQSLLRQWCYEFEWLVIDDGSTDETETLVKQWVEETSQFSIRYFKTVNGGKPRAINKAMELVRTPYFFIIDSDDYLLDDTIKFLSDKIPDIDYSEEIIGIGLRQKNDEVNFDSSLFLNKDYIDATNLQRKQYGLNLDCNELYRVTVFKKFPFIVWEGELFSPEEIVLNDIALHGYKIRWYDKVGVISEYLKDGLTKNNFNLIKNNPMGYSMMFNHKLKYSGSLQDKFTNSYLMVCYSILGNNLSYLSKSNNVFYTILAFPFGVLTAIRRLIQYRYYG